MQSFLLPRAMHAPLFWMPPKQLSKKLRKKYRTKIKRSLLHRHVTREHVKYFNRCWNRIWIAHFNLVNYEKSELLIKIILVFVKMMLWLFSLRFIYLFIEKKNTCSHLYEGTIEYNRQQRPHKQIIQNLSLLHILFDSNTTRSLVVRFQPAVLIYFP